MKKMWTLSLKECYIQFLKYPKLFTMDHEVLKHKLLFTKHLLRREVVCTRASVLSGFVAVKL